MRQSIYFAFLLLFLATPALAGAHDEHGHMNGDGRKGSESHDMAGMDPVKHGMALGHNEMPTEKEESSQNEMGMSKEAFLVAKKIDGYDVTFHVMEAGDGMKHGGSHNLMVKIEKEGAIVTGLKLNSKVVHPNGAEESKPFMPMGDWFSAGYDLGHDGKHQLMVLFKTTDGAKHFGGVHYPQ